MNIGPGGNDDDGEMTAKANASPCLKSLLQGDNRGTCRSDPPAPPFRKKKTVKIIVFDGD